MRTASLPRHLWVLAGLYGFASLLHFAHNAEYIAFYPGRVDKATVDGELVRAQTGGYYGGWITNEVVGPFKGDPGTHGW